MLITAITHASARDKEHNFRALTEDGTQESLSAVARYGELTGEQPIPITRVLSSPKPRCLETAITFVKQLDNEAVVASTVEVDAGLAAGEIEGSELAHLGREAEAGHVLVSGHADLVQTLPEHVRLTADAASDGWFQVRPVIFQLHIEPGAEWSQAELRFCEGLVDGQWQSLVI
jgi:phosphohistidine phosphatase SixA